MEGYKTKEFDVPVKRYCQTMELKDDAELIRRYREAHDKEHFWDEIKEGIKAVGILEMEIYILGNRLFMIVDAPLDFDWDSAMARLATLPRQQEWARGTISGLRRRCHVRPEMADDGAHVSSLRITQYINTKQDNPSRPLTGMRDCSFITKQQDENLLSMRLKVRLNPTA